MHLVMRVARDILIGKAAAVIGGWVLKNALAMTIAIKKSAMLGTTPDKLYDPSYIREQDLQLESLVMALMPFLVLLMFSASLGYWAQQGGWGGFVSHHAGLGRGLAEIQRDISMASSTAASLASSTAKVVHAEKVAGAGVAFEHQVQHGVANLISSPEGTESLREMDNFYKVALAFIPAWAYKDFIAMVLTVFNLWAEPVLLLIAGEGAAGMLFSNTTDSTSANSTTAPANSTNASAEENAEEEGESGSNFAEQTDQIDIDQEVDDVSTVATGGPAFMTQKKPKGWAQLVWNMFLALLCTGLAAALQLHAHIWVENMGDGNYNFLKVMCTCLQTCMFLGTGYAFWNVINTVFDATCSSVGNKFLLNTVCAASVTAGVILLQKLLRRWATEVATETADSFLERGYMFVDKSGNFVMAWAWQAWMNHMFFHIADLILGEQGHSCQCMYFAHYMMNAFLISIFGIALVTLMQVFNAGHDIQATTTLIVGINAGWAWLGFVTALFKCNDDFTIGMYWRYAILTVLVVVVVCFLMELLNRKVDKWIEILGDRIGVANSSRRDSADSFWSEDTEESEEDSSDDSEEDSSDGFKDTKQKS